MRILTIVASNHAPQAELLRLENSDQHPRASLYATVMNSDLMNRRFLATVPLPRRLLYRILPSTVSLILEAFIIKGRYDAVVSWAESLGLGFALLLKLTGSRTLHVGLFSWISRPKKAGLLKRVHTHVNRIILWSSVQMEFAVTSLGIPRSKIRFIRFPVDQKFWRPMEAKIDMICSAGREMRDYTTLIEALKGLQIRCHIAAYKEPGKKDDWFKALENVGSLPEHITIGSKSVTELRELYARSMFVVIPLYPNVETDNGVNVILEAMAMGKPVICSRTKGQVDVIQEGKTGIYVPAGDPAALREAIRQLWENPVRAQTMGKEARAYIEKFHTADQFVNRVKSIVEEVLAGGTESSTS